MKLYKREIKVYSVYPGFQGFQDSVCELTDWLDEEEGIEKFEFYKNKTKEQKFRPNIIMKERFVLLKEDKKLFIWTFVILFVWVIAVSIMLFVKFGDKQIEVDDTIENTKEIVIETVEVLRYTTEKENIEHRDEEIEALCKVVWGEARGCNLTQQAAVVWCVLNRVEDERFPNDIISVLEQPGQFDGYNISYPVDSPIYVLVVDVFNRWSIEQESLGGVGRVLPKEYMWFAGTGTENVFRDSYNGNYNIWNWSLESPYKED